MFDIHQEFSLFLEGKSLNAHKWMGSHLLRDSTGNIYATKFTLYAPHALEVRLVGSFNNYNGDNYKLDKIDQFGLYSITINKNLEYETYKYKIVTKDHKTLYKSDPFAFYAEQRPNNASRVYDIDNYNWNDSSWFKNKVKPYKEPVLIYEMHLGSWQREFGGFKTYNKLADELINYINYMGYTHVEFLPVYEHPLDDSWGYQGTGFFAATSRFGSPKDLMYLIDRLHQANIGVIIDWVLGHINKDDFGLSMFDGTPLYEIENDFLRENVVWGTSNLDFSKGITRSFMSSALTFWLDYFHLDGFRIDAVSNLIYYLGNEANGTNNNAINYLKELSTIIFNKDDRLIFSAEDSTAYPKVTHSVSSGGIGFNYKWNMGFMNDTLEYFKKDPIYRKYHSNLITFSMVYAYNEQFILPFSHDEVVHMKGSLLNKMPGDYNLKFANLRLMFTYYMTFPGKKLLFMGQDFGSFSEWDFNKELDWNVLADFEAHQKLHRYFRDLAHVYKYNKAMYELDHNPKGFKWIINDHHDSSVFSYLRKSSKETLLVVLNMTPNYYEEYEIGVPSRGEYIEILNSNKKEYGGENNYNGLPLKTIKGDRNGYPYYLKVKVSSLAGIILKLKKE